MAVLVPLIPCICIFLICFLIGLIGNTLLIVATIQNKALHNANKLVALNAFGDILHLIGHIPLAYYIFTGITFTPLRTCIWMQLVPNLGLNISMVTLLLIGLDRTIAILKPVKYRKLMQFGEPVTILLALLYAFTFLILVFKYGNDDNVKVICVLVAVYRDELNSIWGISTGAFLLATIILYTILRRIMKKTGTANRNTELLQTLWIVVAFIGMGQLISVGVFVLTYLLSITGITKFYIICYGGIFINISVSFNWLFYYWRSTEYRNELKKQLRRLPCFKNIASSFLAPKTQIAVIIPMELQHNDA